MLLVPPALLLVAGAVVLAVLPRAARGAVSVLLPLLRQRSIHVVIGGIALPNEASVALHEKFGLSKVAHFAEVGRKFDRWIDVGYWQRVL